MHRRRFVVATAAALLRAEPDEPQTLVYKQAGECDIKADLFGLSTSERKPVAVWIHGGALILGSRRLGPNARVLRSLLDKGFAVISIDYRLAPETKLPGIIEDVQDAFRWIVASADKFRIEPNRLVVCGGSAGGYLTLMSGFSVDPCPAATVSYWGYGDIAGRWYSEPDPFYSQQPAVTREQALAAVGNSQRFPSLHQIPIGANSIFTAASKVYGRRKSPVTIQRKTIAGLHAIVRFEM